MTEVIRKLDIVMNCNREKCFTLIELIFAMAVFLLLLVAVITFFYAAKNVWSFSDSRKQAFEDARVALDLMTRDLQCVYYTDDIAPFWLKTKGNDGKWYDDVSINFISLTDIGDVSGSTSSLYEVKYQLWYPENGVQSDSDGWLMRSVTGSSSPKWNFNNYPLSVGISGTNKAFTANNDSNEPFNKFIPCVTRVEFNCFDRAWNVISGTTSTPQRLPYSVEIKLYILSKIDWQKWIAIGGKPSESINDTEEITNSSAANFRKKHELVFSKTILLSERGQN